MSRPVEKGKVLYCFTNPSDAGDRFIDLISWSSGAVSPIAELITKIQEYRKAAIAERRKQKQGYSRVTTAEILEVLQSRGDMIRGYAAAKITQLVRKVPKKHPREVPKPKWALRSHRSTSEAGVEDLRISGVIQGSALWCNRVNKWYAITRPPVVQPLFDSLDAAQDIGPMRSESTDAAEKASNRLLPHFDQMDDTKVLTLGTGSELDGQVSRCVAYCHQQLSRFARSLPESISNVSNRYGCRTVERLIAVGIRCGTIIDLNQAEQLRSAHKLVAQPTTSAYRDAVADQPSSRWNLVNSEKGVCRLMTVMDGIEAPLHMRECVERYVRHFSKPQSQDVAECHKTFGATAEARCACMVTTLAATAVIRCLMDFRRRKGHIVCKDAMPHALWFLERASQGSFVAIQVLLRRWRKSKAGKQYAHFL